MLFCFCENFKMNKSLKIDLSWVSCTKGQWAIRLLVFSHFVVKCHGGPRVFLSFRDKIKSTKKMLPNLGFGKILYVAGMNY